MLTVENRSSYPKDICGIVNKFEACHEVAVSSNIDLRSGSFDISLQESQVRFFEREHCLP